MTRYRDFRRWWTTGMIVLLTAWILPALSPAGASSLILAPHPDDDVITSAGVIYRALEKGETVHVVYMTNGDWAGVNRGLTRQDEASTAQIDHLGMLEDNLIFLGYPDGYLENIYLAYPGSTDQLTTHNGQSTTYGQRGLGRSDYHTFRFGSPAAYNRHNILVDLEDILDTYQPDHIFVTSEHDTHDDHSTTHLLLKMALDQVILGRPGYNPTVHETIVWSDDSSAWPNALDPMAFFDPIAGLDATGLIWGERESIDVPLAMQLENYPLNWKYQAIGSHITQGQLGGYIGRFVHKDEFFWPKLRSGVNRPPVADAGLDQSASEGAFVTLDASGSFDPDLDPLSYTWVQTGGSAVVLSGDDGPAPTFNAPTGLPGHEILTFELVVSDGSVSTPPDLVRVNVSAALAPVYGANVGLTATATASSARVGSEAVKAIDGFAIGYPEDSSLEWTSDGETVGAWIQLDWASAVTIGKIVLFDRPNHEDYLRNATLTFSDGSSLDVGPLDNFGRSSIFEFSARTVDQVRLTVSQVGPASNNVGLSEFEVYEAASATGNHFPVANAGPDQTVDEGAVVPLDGTASYDPDDDALTYQWVQTGGIPVALTDPAASIPVFDAPTGLGADETLTFSLTVNDGELTSTPDTVDITVLAAAPPNRAPVADAGPDQTVGEGAAVLLNGTGSSDPDDDTLTYAWTQTAGFGVSLSSTTSPSPTFDAPTGLSADEILTFSLVVNDGEFDSPPDTVDITVTPDPPPGGGTGNIAPDASSVIASTARDGGGQGANKAVDGFIDGYPGDSTREWSTQAERAGAWIELTWALPQTVNRIVLYDRINDDDWITSCTLTFSDNSSIVVGALDNLGGGDEILFPPKTITSVRMTVDTASGSTWSIGLAEFEVYLEDPDANRPPVADAGLDQTVDEAAIVQLNGTGSSDPDADLLTYTWTQIAGDGVNLSSTTSPAPTFDAPIGLLDDALLTFSLVVNDGEADSPPDTVDITVLAAAPPNRAPVADAGPDQTVGEGAAVLLNGTGSSDPDDDTLTYAWTQTAGFGVSLSSTTSPSPTFDAPTGLSADEILTFSLVVNDGEFDSPPDTVDITVTPDPPPPGGGTGNIAPDASSVIASTARDGGGQGANKAVDGFIDGYPGDSSREWSTQAEGAGAWIELTWALPQTVNRIVLYDRINDDDWITSCTLTFSDNSSIVVGALDNLGGGDEILFPPKTITSVRMTVDTASGSTWSIGLAEFEVYLEDPDANRPPVADAGLDQTVDEAAIVQLNGTGSSDPDADLLTYTWTQIAGDGVNLSSTTSPAPTFDAPIGLLDDALLTFSLVVNDGEADSPPDTVDITVLAAAPPNRAPAADAGPDQTVGEGTAVLLNGTGSSDPDDDTLTYAWTQTAGFGVSLSSTTSPSPTFDAPTGLSADEILTFSLVVNDGEFDSPPDTVDITVTPDPPPGGGTGNVALDAISVIASTDRVGGGQGANKAVDGFIDGYPGDSTREWSTQAEGAGAWIELTWALPQTVDRIVLYDRINDDDWITSCTLTFSDNSSIVVGALDNLGGGDEILFPPKTITSVRMTVDTASGSTWSIGLAEFEVYTTVE